MNRITEKDQTDREASLTVQILDFARECPYGFTFDIRSRQLHDADRGYVVAVYSADTTKESIPEILKLAKKHNLHLVGGWWNKLEAKYEFDACCWFEDCSEAVIFAWDQKQKAIWDCENEVVIDLRINI